VLLVVEDDAASLELGHAARVTRDWSRVNLACSLHPAAIKAYARRDVIFQRPEVATR
jgi:hypothetical protein